MTQIMIFGAGAMGCLIGAKLQEAGESVCYVARGKQKEALEQDGLTLVCGEHIWQQSVQVIDAEQAAGTKPDILFVTVKSHQLPDCADQIAAIIGDETLIVPALNGIPWWYFQRQDFIFPERRLESLDPHGVVSDAIPSQQLIGCVNYLAAHVSKPGVVHYVDYFTKSMVIGELDNSDSDRLQRLYNILSNAGLDPVLSTKIRDSIWHKLWGNIAFNPISALTHATMDKIAEDYDDTDLVLAVMNEARHIAEKLDVTFTESPHARVRDVAKRRGHKTSMLQDMEAGRPTEIEAIVGAVREIGLSLEESMPYLNSLYSLVKQKERFFTRRAMEELPETGTASLALPAPRRSA